MLQGKKLSQYIGAFQKLNRTRYRDFKNGSFSLFSHQPVAEILAWIFGPFGILANIYVLASCIQNLMQKHRNRNKVTSSNTCIAHSANKNGKKIKRTLSRSVTVLLASLSLGDTLSSLYLFILAISNIYYMNLKNTANRSQINTNFSPNDQIISSVAVISRHNSSINGRKSLSMLWITGISCQVLRFLVVTGSVASTGTAFIIAIDRFVAVVYPFQITWRIYYKRAIKYCILIWCYAIVNGSIAIFFVNLPDSSNDFNYISWFSGLCILSKITQTLISIYATFLTLSTLIVYVPICVMYAIIVHRMRKITNLKKFTTNNKRLNVLLGLHHDKLLGIAITSIIVSTNMLFWLPWILLNIIGIIDKSILAPGRSINSFGPIIMLLVPCNGLINALTFIIVPLVISHKKSNKMA